MLNFIIQSVLQPKFVGDAVGLTTTVSFLSLIVWAYILGPIGAILAIPASLLVKALLVDMDPDAQWLGLFLGDKPVFKDKPAEGRTRRKIDGRAGARGPTRPAAGSPADRPPPVEPQMSCVHGRARTWPVFALAAGLPAGLDPGGCGCRADGLGGAGAGSAGLRDDRRGAAGGRPLRGDPVAGAVRGGRAAPGTWWSGRCRRPPRCPRRRSPRSPVGTPRCIVALTAALAIVTGIAGLLAGLLRLGFIASFISEPVLKGFIVGLALTIMIGQVPKFFGVPKIRGRLLPADLGGDQRISATPRRLTLLVGCAEPGGGAGLQALVRRWFRGRCWRCCWAPAASVMFGLQAPGCRDRRRDRFRLAGFRTAGRRRAARLSRPGRPGGRGADRRIRRGARARRRPMRPRPGTRSRPNRELVGLGAANLGSGLCAGMVVNGSLSKTAVNGAAGARSQVSGLVVAVLTLITLLFLTGLFEQLPEATLSAVVIAAVIELVDFPALRRLYRVWTDRLGSIYGFAARADFAAAIAAMLGVLIFDTLPGLVIGIGVSMLLLLYRVSRPHVAGLAKRDGAWLDVERHDDLDGRPDQVGGPGGIGPVLRQQRPCPGADRGPAHAADPDRRARRGDQPVHRHQRRRDAGPVGRVRCAGTGSNCGSPGTSASSGTSCAVPSRRRSTTRSSGPSTRRSTPRRRVRRTRLPSEVPAGFWLRWRARSAAPAGEPTLPLLHTELAVGVVADRRVARGVQAGGLVDLQLQSGRRRGCRSSWARVRAPRMTEVTAGRSATQASATCAIDTPAALGDRCTASMTSQVRCCCVRRSYASMPRPGSSPSRVRAGRAARRAGTCRSASRRPAATTAAARGPRPGGRHDLPLDLPDQQVVLRLQGDRARQVQRRSASCDRLRAAASR